MTSFLTYVRVFDYVNLISTGLAAGVNFYAAKRSFLEVRVRLYVTAFLALMYSIAYSILIFTNVGPAAWSNGVRGYGFLAWGIVWIWPAITVIKVSRVADRRMTSREGFENDRGE